MVSARHLARKITAFPETDRKVDSIAVFVDRMTKMVQMKAVRMDITATQFAEVLKFSLILCSNYTVYLLISYQTETPSSPVRSGKL
jgi:hypothetical protein